MNPKGQRPIDVAGMIQLMEKMAPPFLAESWDNCGLQVGSLQWTVRKVWVALDPLYLVLSAAAEQGVDLLITHHPLIFKPLKSIDLDTQEGKAIAVALKAQMAIYAAHTNLDSAKNGINDVLAHKIGLKDLEPLVPAKPDDAHDDEIAGGGSAGMGRMGRVDQSTTVMNFAQEIKTRLGLTQIKVAGKTDRPVRRVAVCSGSGGSLLSNFLASGADLFVSGDLRYHDARAIEEAGRALIDIGHFASEHLMVDALYHHLDRAVSRAGWAVEVAPCRIEQDPFKLI